MYQTSLMPKVEADVLQRVRKILPDTMTWLGFWSYLGRVYNMEVRENLSAGEQLTALTETEVLL